MSSPTTAPSVADGIFGLGVEEMEAARIGDQREPLARAQPG